jgi:hypothetical protein
MTEKKPTKTVPTPSTDDVLALMAGMRAHGVACVELPGVKLALMPVERSAAPRAVPVPELSAQQAQAQTIAARTRLEELRAARISAASGQRPTRAAFVPPVAKLAEDVFKEAQEAQRNDERSGLLDGADSGER